MKTQDLIDYNIRYIGYLSISGQDYRTCINLFSLYFTMIIDFFALYLKTAIQKQLNGTKTLYNSCVNVMQITQLEHYVFTTFQFGCSLVRLIS